MRRTILTIFAFALFMLIPVDALAQTTQGPTKIKGTATNGLSLEVTGPAQFDSNLNVTGTETIGSTPSYSAYIGPLSTMTASWNLDTTTGLTAYKSLLAAFGGSSTGTGSSNVTTFPGTLAATTTNLGSIITNSVQVTPGVLLGTFATGPKIDNLEVDADGNIWWADYINFWLKVMRPDGTILNTIPMTYEPTIVNFAPDGSAWVTLQENNAVLRMAKNGTITGPFAVGSSPDYAAFDRAGNVWVPNTGAGTVTILNPAGGFMATCTLGSSQNPWGLAFDAGGNAWTSNYNTNSVSEMVLNYNPNTTAYSCRVGREVAVGTHPIPIYSDTTGNYMWVGNSGDNTISKIDTNSGGVVFTVPSGGTFPTMLSIDGNNNVWVVNQNSNNIAEISASGSLLLTRATGNSPTFSAIDAAGNLWVPNLNDNTVSKFSTTGGVRTPITPPGPGSNVPQSDISVNSIQVIGVNPASNVPTVSGSVINVPNPTFSSVSQNQLTISSTSGPAQIVANGGSGATYTGLAIQASNVNQWWAGERSTTDYQIYDFVNSRTDEDCPMATGICNFPQGISAGAITGPMFIGSQSVTIAPASAAGSGATATCYTTQGNQCTASSGLVKLVTGTGPTAGGVVNLTTSAQAYTLNCNFTPANAASFALGWFGNPVSTTEQQIMVANAPAASTTYYVTYTCQR